MRDEAVARASRRVAEAWGLRPRCGIILGTGLGGLVDRMEERVAIDYEDLSGWPRCTAPGHAGRLVCGRLAQAPVVAIDGRFHLYEGRTVDELTLPVRLLADLGVEFLFVSNAAGGLNPRLGTGDLLVIAEHLNLMGRRSMLTGDERAGIRGAALYDPELRELALRLARRAAIPAATGTYVAVSGPNYETRAEYRFLRRIGGDVVGMSTIPEVLAAARLRLRTLALSIVTNVARPDALRETSSDEVVAAANEAAPRLCRLVESVCAAITGSSGIRDAVPREKEGAS